MLDVARFLAGIEMVTGAMFIVWLSGRNGKYGVGGRMAFGLVNILERIAAILLNYPVRRLLLPVTIAMVMMMITMILENAEMRIPVQRVSIHKHC